MSSERRPSPPGVWAGVLAAGAGRRMGGRPKALLRWRGRTFLETIARSAREGGAEGVAVVLGHHAHEVRELALRTCDEVGLNPDPDRGMGSSARELARLVPRGCSLLLWPSDTPTIRPETIRALIDASRAHPGRVIEPIFDGEAGHPPLLPPMLVNALTRLPDEQRLDRFIAESGGEPIGLEVDDPGVIRDVDRPLDLKNLDEAAQ